MPGLMTFMPGLMTVHASIDRSCQYWPFMPVLTALATTGTTLATTGTTLATTGINSEKYWEIFRVFSGFPVFSQIPSFGPVSGGPDPYHGAAPVIDRVCPGALPRVPLLLHHCCSRESGRVHHAVQRQSTVRQASLEYSQYLNCRKPAYWTPLGTVNNKPVLLVKTSILVLVWEPLSGIYDKTVKIREKW